MQEYLGFIGKMLAIIINSIFTRHIPNKICKVHLSVSAMHRLSCCGLRKLQLMQVSEVYLLLESVMKMLKILN